MRKSIRIAAASALALPLALGVSGVAFADDTTITQDTAGSATGAQGADVSQGNGSAAPVTQVNPAANAEGIAGLSNFANEDVRGGSGQSVVQDNSIESSTEQGNAASVEQAQKTVLDQTAGLG
ncbi:hypothetical protein GCM10009613_36490 [Pseudonocardia kongjuensis]|uniref:Secreted protein n=1 Tax=Pseudonocardia kongjuensis TaxID=102227 RepID=A0ABP4IP49_9PSEU